MWDILIGVVAALVTIACMQYQRRIAAETTRREVINEAAGALAETLQVALDAKVITSQDCLKIMGLWGHMLMEQGNQKQCACGNVSLHCDKDKAVMAGITHTTKYCDTTAEGEDDDE